VTVEVQHRPGEGHDGQGEGHEETEGNPWGGVGGGKDGRQCIGVIEGTTG
jgi:hypothetical protein